LLEQRGTLDDQVIFGPLRDFECACGKYQGPNHNGMICDRCGVKVTSPDVRRERFGHFEFVAEVRHPLGGATDVLSAFPVLPAAFVCSHGGKGLADLYDELVEATAPELAGGLARRLSRLAEMLLPVVQLAHWWDLAEAVVLARGLALEPRDELTNRS
jgi:hypothetical protein